MDAKGVHFGLTLRYVTAGFNHAVLDLEIFSWIFGECTICVVEAFRLIFGVAGSHSAIYGMLGGTDSVSRAFCA